eukprot:TRINITY_DN1092_c0_g1_i2.p1 TRINITY_DN1092_c0_g1~~TRINITY_DN1092_c0_g1_i2.p1  ORF type:complete len:289 (-),score=37.37 TRINITY_DN1092_c0_g1_i2:28-894(-)
MNFAISPFFPLAAAVCLAILPILLLTPNDSESGAVRVVNITCAPNEDLTFVTGCSTRHCSRFVIPDFVDAASVRQLIRLVDTAFSIPISGSKAGGSGPVSIVDFQSGALSYGQNFVDLYRIASSGKGEPNFPRFNQSDFALYQNIKERIQEAIKQHYGLEKLWFTSPTFFSRITGDRPAQTKNDEYWHNHIDRIAYPSFYYTGLLYLTDGGQDFEGGRFLFVDSDGTQTTEIPLQPRAGMLSVFTSGDENVHRVEQVTKGVRYALTIAFTCDETKHVDNFLSRKSVLF